MWVNCPFHVTRVRREASRVNVLGLGTFFLYFFFLFLADFLFRKSTACDPCVASKIKCAASPEDAKNKKPRRKKTEDEHTGIGEASEPDWVGELFELMEALGRMYSDMSKEDRKWKKKIEKRLDEMQETLDGMVESGSEEEPEASSEQKDKGKGKEKEKGPEGDEDVDMGS